MLKMTLVSSLEGYKRWTKFIVGIDHESIWLVPDAGINEFFFFNLVVLIIFSLTEYGNTSSESDKMFLLVFCQEMHLMWCLTIIDPM